MTEWIWIAAEVAMQAIAQSAEHGGSETFLAINGVDVIAGELKWWWPSSRSPPAT